MSTFNQPREPGFRFKEGKLYVFGESDVVLVHGWPELEAVRKADGTKWWESFEPQSRFFTPQRPWLEKKRAATSRAAPDEDLPLLDRAGIKVQRRKTLPQQRKLAYAQFRRSFPPEVVQATEHFLSHQWHPMHLFKLLPSQAADLFAANPALAFCLANNDKLIPPEIRA